MSDLLDALVSIEIVMAALGCSRSRVYELLADGTLDRGPKFGRRTLITAASVRSAIHSGPVGPAPTKSRRRVRRARGSLSQQIHAAADLMLG